MELGAATKDTVNLETKCFKYQCSARMTILTMRTKGSVGMRKRTEKFNLEFRAECLYHKKLKDVLLSLVRLVASADIIWFE